MNNKLEQKLLQTYSNKIIFKNIENFEGFSITEINDGNDDDGLKPKY